jgi:N-acetylglutamate synthase-like GNAT family acetyltransferase
LVKLVRRRPNDLVDPYPPCTEAEVLVDMAARKSGDSPALVIEDQGLVVGYGAIDYSPDMRRAQLVGPVVHPAHRRKGHGGTILEALLQQAREAKQKYVRGAIGADNGAGRAQLEGRGFKQRERLTCFRMGRPTRTPASDVEGVRLERVDADGADAYFEYSSRALPRGAKQTRSLLKNEDYVVVQAFQGDNRVGCVELDLRLPGVAVIETIEALPSLLHRGLGTGLLAEAVRLAFEGDATDHLEFLVPAGDRTQLEELTGCGLGVHHEILGYEAKL